MGTQGDYNIVGDKTWKLSDHELSSGPTKTRKPVEHKAKRAVNYSDNFKAYILQDELVPSEVVILTPASYKDAMALPQCEKWCQAMQEEFGNLLKNMTWELIPLPPGHKVIKGHWCFN